MQKLGFSNIRAFRQGCKSAKLLNANIDEILNCDDEMGLVTSSVVLSLLLVRGLIKVSWDLVRKGPQKPALCVIGL